MTAAIALEQLASAMAHDIVLGRTAARAPKAIRPTGDLDRLGALRLGPKLAEELQDRHAVLQLDCAERHGARALMRQAQPMGSGAHSVS